MYEVAAGTASPRNDMIASSPTAPRNDIFTSHCEAPPKQSYFFHYNKILICRKKEVVATNLLKFVAKTSRRFCDDIDIIVNATIIIDIVAKSP